jgi:hypothetical protein
MTIEPHTNTIAKDTKVMNFTILVQASARIKEKIHSMVIIFESFGPDPHQSNFCFPHSFITNVSQG